MGHCMMRTHRGQPVGRSRAVASARTRRALVYALAVVSVGAAALIAVRLAHPPDPYARVRVERLPGAPSKDVQGETEVGYDAEGDRTLIRVRDADGTVRRYYVDESGGEWRLAPAPETAPSASSP